MTLSRSEIESRALDVLTTANALTTPVPVERVAESLGAQLHFEALEDQVSGMLVCKGEAKHIVINVGHHPNRQRFSIAHECGHLMLHHGTKDRLFLDTHMRVYQRAGSSLSPAYADTQSATTPEEEREANAFASAILMPRALLEVQAQALGIDVLDEQGVALLAIGFGVSEQAMSIRLQRLGLITLAT